MGWDGGRWMVVGVIDNYGFWVVKEVKNLALFLQAALQL